jgi:asparagine synthase (glutamine-hydrolysing)
MELTALEIASGLVYGLDDETDTRAGRRLASPSPVQALERALLPALRRPPCLVSFSGGRDSSAVLALATRVASREGLPAPIPATNRFPGVEESDESAWQERVVAHLRLEDWVRLDWHDELDSVGPVAARVLRRHGLLWPFNTHFHEPIAEHAAGGSLLTGIGGDEFLSESSWSRQLAVLGARARPEPRDALRVGFLAAPRPLRRLALRRRLPITYGWLTPDARRASTAAFAADGAAEPVRWASRLRWIRRFRDLTVGPESLGLLARHHDVLLAQPFLDRAFAEALLALPRGARFGDRTAAMRSLFGDLLPADVIERPTKSSFDPAFWNVHSRSLAASWDGSGIDGELVDAEGLRHEWSLERPDPRSFLLLQAVWLAGERLPDRGQEQLDRRGQRLPASGAPQLPTGKRGDVEQRGGIARRNGDAPVQVQPAQPLSG